MAAAPRSETGGRHRRYRGIGRAVADRLAAEDWDVLVLARHPVATPHRFIACNVVEAEDVRRVFAGLIRVDALVNCAGIAGANRLDADDTLWHAIIGSNLHGTYHTCKAALPLLPDNTGRIINIASVLGLRRVPDQTAYCAAKHGVVGLTRALALAVAPRGITVNALCPGWVATEMAEQRYAELASRGNGRFRSAVRPRRHASRGRRRGCMASPSRGTRHHWPCSTDRWRRSGPPVTRILEHFQPDCAAVNALPSCLIA